MKHAIWISVFLASLLLTACESRHGEPEKVLKTVSGTLNYRERMMLSPEAVARVSLQDVSRADAPATVISSIELLDPGQAPIPFELTYDPEEIDVRMSYHVQAQIFDRGELMFTSDTHNPVLTHGGGHRADIRLVRVLGPRVSPPGPKETGAAPGEAASLSGMFTYLADAALFVDCRDQRVYPVSMEGAYIELERAYLNSGIKAGEPLFSEVEGRFLERPSMDGNHNEIMLIVDSFKAIYPEQSCVPPVAEPLINTYWKLKSLDSHMVKTPKGQHEAHMVLVEEDSRVRGNAGCNNFFGTYETGVDSLSFGQIGATMMACLEGTDTETGFLAALAATDRYEINGPVMNLYRGDQPLARFEAVQLR